MNFKVCTHADIALIRKVNAYAVVDGSLIILDDKHPLADIDVVSWIEVDIPMMKHIVSIIADLPSIDLTLPRSKKKEIDRFRWYGDQAKMVYHCILMEFKIDDIPNKEYAF